MSDDACAGTAAAIAAQAHADDVGVDAAAAWMMPGSYQMRGSLPDMQSVAQRLNPLTPPVDPDAIFRENTLRLINGLQAQIARLQTENGELSDMIALLRMQMRADAAPPPSADVKPFPFRALGDRRVQIGLVVPGE